MTAETQGSETSATAIAEPCGPCQLGYHGVCEAPESALGTPCGCTVPDVDHDPDWDALRKELGDD